MQGRSESSLNPGDWTWLRRFLDDPRANVLVSLGWLGVGWLIALWAPWLGLTLAGLDLVVNVMALLFTLTLVTWNLWASFKLLHRTGRPLHVLPLTCAQILLFTLLFYQIARHAGAHHYAWNDPPGPLSWFFFAVIHATRTFDLMDGIEAYGWIQPIRNESLFTSFTLIAYHLIVSVFVLSLLVAVFAKVRQWLVGKEWFQRWGLRVAFAAAGVFIVTWLSSALYFRPWRPVDIPLWLVDNVLRTVDFFDGMAIFHARLHSVPALAWEGTLTVVFRIMLMVILADVLWRFSARVRLRRFGGLALTEDDLVKMSQEEADDALRRKAYQRLEELREHHTRSGDPHKRWQSPPMIWAAGGLLTLFLVVLALEAWVDPPEVRLAGVATSNVFGKSDRAHRALRRMGSAAYEAVPDLEESLPELSPQEQRKAIETLGYLGAPAAPALGRLLHKFADAGDAELAKNVVASLERIGPKATATLVDAQSLDDPEIRDACRITIVNMGRRAVQELIDNVDETNVIEVVALLDELDPYWTWLTSENPKFAQVVAAQLAGEILGNPSSTDEDVLAAATKLVEIGPLAAAELVRLSPDDLTRATLALDKRWQPDNATWLVDLLMHDDSRVKKAATLFFMSLEKRHEVVTLELVDRIKSAGSNVRARAEAVLLSMNTTAPYAVPELVEMLVSDQADHRLAAVNLTKKMTVIQTEVVLALVDRLKSDDTNVRARAEKTLLSLPTAAGSAVSQLVDMLVSNEPEHRSAAVRLVTKLDGVQAEVGVALFQRWKSDNPNERANAQAALLNLPTASGHAVPGLIDMLVSDEGVHRRAAIGLATKLPDVQAQVVVELLDRLESGEASLRARVERVLVRLGVEILFSDQQNHLPAAVGLAIKSEEVRENIVVALLNRLKSDDSNIRTRAEAALGHLGNAARDAVPELVDMLLSEQSKDRRRAVRLLEKVDRGAELTTSQIAQRGLPTIKRVIELCETDDGAVRATVVRIVQRVGKKSPQVVDLLLERLNASSYGRETVQSAESLLAEIAPGRLKRVYVMQLQPLRKFFKGFLRVSRLGLAPDGRTFVTARSNAALVWDVATDEPLRTIRTDKRGFIKALTPDGRRCVSRSQESKSTLRVWDLETGECLKILKGDGERINAVALTPDGLTIVSGCADKTVRVWDVSSGDGPRKLEGHTGAVYAVALTADGRTCVSGSEDKTLRVWDLATGKCLKILGDRRRSAYYDFVALTPDGRTCVAARRFHGKSVQVWDVAAGKYLRTLEGHSGAVNAVALTPDGRTCVSGSRDKTLRVWDVETGECLRTLEGHSGGVLAVAITPDGQTIVSGGWRSVRVWGRPVAKAREKTKSPQD